MYLEETITQEQYADRKKPLDIALERHAEEVAALSQELDQSHQLEEQVQSMTKFAESATKALEQLATASQKREIV